MKQICIIAAWLLASMGSKISNCKEIEKVSRCNPDTPSVYNFTVGTLDGKQESLSKYEGSPLIIVNVATFCKFTEQYVDFNPLLDKYKLGTKGAKKPLYMAAFPCNQFHLQEPGENNEILNGLQYVRPGHGFVPHPNLHIYGKLDVNGENAHPLYNFLKEACPPTTKIMGFKPFIFWDNLRADDITWNFEKFIIDAAGHPVYRLHPETWNNSTIIDKFIDQIGNNAGI